jgi:hypothetical protein
VKIRKVAANNRKAQLEMTVRSGKTYPLPYAKLDPRPTSKDKVRDVYVDAELGREGVTYVLESGEEGSVHIDHALEYNEDPGLLSELLVHRLTLAAREHMEGSGLSRREVARSLKTSVPQLYRLLDTANTKKSINQLVELLHVLGCEVELIVKDKSAA